MLESVGPEPYFQQRRVFKGSLNKKCALYIHIPYTIYHMHIVMGLLGSRAVGSGENAPQGLHLGRRLRGLGSLKSGSETKPDVILYHITLYSIILYYNIFYCTSLCRLYSIYHIVLCYYVILYYAVYYFMLYHIILYYIFILCCTFFMLYHIPAPDHIIPG